LRLQGSLTKTQPIKVDAKKEAPPSKRGDTFVRKVFRNDDPDEEQTAALASGTFRDKSAVFSFNK